MEFNSAFKGLNACIDSLFTIGGLRRMARFIFPDTKMTTNAF